MSSSAKRHVLFWNCLFLSVCVTSANLAQANTAPLSNLTTTKMSNRINRSVLTVGREIFSATDAVALLALWNLTRSNSEKSTDIETKWLAGFSLKDTLQTDAQLIDSAWPEDVRVFFRIALVWVDVQKLNLFIPSDQEIKQLLERFEAKKETLLLGVEPALAVEIVGASERTKRRWVEMAIRARTFMRVRGVLEKNRTLFNIGWYWHNMDGNEGKPR